MTNPDGALVSVMVMFGDGWNWPQEDDELWYSYNNIMQVIKPPVLSTADNMFLVKEITKYRKQ